eukprot:11930219-Prorocentrum_lima.AAC.1
MPPWAPPPTSRATASWLGRVGMDCPHAWPAPAPVITGHHPSGVRERANELWEESQRLARLGMNG